ncbi:NAD(P)-binding protein [Rickenella mellea]|uniref:NAD(P)-binding protein n=1 Tax=Rickenella mellea TaxID=50990 RepID=A0A4Y7Q8F6_9AGAM|nr:NAD(P)-binding protein [Rickenella mellea]
MSTTRILITGATGFVGSHILQQALEAGHPVNITTRLAKVDALQKHLGDSVQVFGVDDAATGDYSNALKGVGAIIHCAAPISSKADSDGLLRGAIDGALNIVKQAVAAGIFKIVITSSWVTANFDDKFMLSDYIYTDKDWNPATKEETRDKTHDAWWFYQAAKTIAEQEVWAFADQHPEVDITMINPPYLYGPFAKQFQIEKGDYAAFSTNGYFYRNVLKVQGKLPAVQQVGPLNVDVRDVAKAHLLALKAPPTSEVGRKRLLVGEQFFTWKDAVEHLKTVRLELKDRLPDTSEAQELTIAKIDTKRAADVLGLTTYTDWKKTVEDTADNLLAIEKNWAA